MACLGVHYAVAAEDGRRLLAAEGQDAVLQILAEWARRRDEAWLAPSGQAWDAMHRCLSNGTLFRDEGEPPLNRTVLGGRHLYQGDDLVVSYLGPDEVKAVAGALAPITEVWLSHRYDAIDPDDYDGLHGAPDFDAVWKAFAKVRELYRTAALAGRAVVFTTDP